MAARVLKSIHPVNLLSFGPKTQPIELRDLNILIGPNGSGKSNFIEIIRLIHFLPDKNPWGSVLATGGAGEWIWKGTRTKRSQCSINAKLSLGELPGIKAEDSNFSMDLEKYEASFRVKRESIRTFTHDESPDTHSSWFERSGSQGNVHLRMSRTFEQPPPFDLNLDRSILSQLASPTVQATGIGEIFLSHSSWLSFSKLSTSIRTGTLEQTASPRSPASWPVGHAPRRGRFQSSSDTGVLSR